MLQTKFHRIPIDISERTIGLLVGLIFCIPKTNFNFTIKAKSLTASEKKI